MTLMMLLNLNSRDFSMLMDKSNQEIEQTYGHSFNEYEIWIIDKYLKFLNESEDTEDYLRNVLYSFLALRDTYKH